MTAEQWLERRKTYISAALHLSVDPEERLHGEVKMAFNAGCVNGECAEEDAYLDAILGDPNNYNAQGEFMHTPGSFKKAMEEGA